MFAHLLLGLCHLDHSEEVNQKTQAMVQERQDLKENFWHAMDSFHDCMRAVHRALKDPNKSCWHSVHGSSRCRSSALHGHAAPGSCVIFVC